MNNIIQTITITILMCFATNFLYAEYTISLQEYIAPNGDCKANVYITVDGNAGPFDIGFYHLDYPDVAYETFDGVESGTTIQYEMYNVVNIFTVRIEDAFGCEYVEDVQYDCDCGTIDVDFSQDEIIHPLTCDDGDNTGSYSKIQQFIFNGSPPYTYNWGDPHVVDNGWTFDGFAHGTYIVTVTDENECTATDKIEFIAQNAPGYSSQITKPCTGIPNGEILFFSGGTSMTWSTGDITTDPSILLSDLGPGDYCVTITDAVSQCEIEHCIQLEEKPDCGEFEISTDDIVLVKSCKEQPTGSATVPATGGNPYPGAGVEVNCNSSVYFYSWGRIEGNNTVIIPNETFSTIDEVFAGIYSATVTDQCGREVIHQVEVEEHPEIEAALTPIIGCPGEGTLSVLPSLGAGGPYSIYWPHQPNNTTNMMTGLDQGTYTVEITDVAGCMNSFMAFVPNHPEMQLSFSLDQNVCFVPDGLDPISVQTFQSGMLNLSITWIGGTGPTNLTANYQWNDIDNSTSQDLNNITHEDFAFGTSSKTFVVTVVDENGCSISDSYTVSNSVTMKKYTEEQDECGVHFYCDGILEYSQAIDEFIECDVYSEEDCGLLECFCDYEGNFQNISPALDNFMDFPMNLPEVEQNQVILPEIGMDCIDTKNCPPFSNVTVPNKPNYISPFAGLNPINRDPCPVEITNISPNPYDFINDTDDVEVDFFVPEGGGTVQIICAGLNFSDSQIFNEGDHSIIIPKSYLTTTGEFEVRLTFGQEIRTATLVVDCVFDYTSFDPNPIDASVTECFISFVTPASGPNLSFRIFNTSSGVEFFSTTLSTAGCVEDNVIVSFGQSFPGGASNYTSELTLGSDTKTIPFIVDNFDSPDVVETRASGSNIDIRMYPNPAQNKVLLETNIKDPFSIKVLDMLGEVYLQKRAEKQSTTIDLTSLTVGTYIIQVECEGATYYKKLIKI